MYKAAPYLSSMRIAPAPSPVRAVVQEDQMKQSVRRIGVAILTAGVLLGANATMQAQGPNNASRSGCRVLPSWDDLRAALVAATAAPNGLLRNNMWGTIVDRDGVVCAVAFTGTDRTNQWLGSRVISAQKANTANAFSLPPGSSGAFPQG